MALAAAAALVAAALQSASGFGYALVLAPAAFAVFDPAEALMVVLIGSVYVNLLMLLAERRPLHVRTRELAMLLALALPGLVAGVFILNVLSKPALQVIVGVAVVAIAALQVRGAFAAEPHPGEGGWPGATLTGISAGTLTTTTGTNGPPMLLWFHRLGLAPAATRDSLAAGFLCLDVVGMGVLALEGEDFGVPSATALAALIALTAVGHAAGRAIFERLDARRFRALGLALVVAAGIASIAAGAAG